MAIIVKKPFRGVPDGECHPRLFNKGDELTGDLADVAVKNGWAEKGEGKAEKEAKAKAKADEEAAAAKAKADEEAAAAKAKAD
ncbi:MAG: hypothetical protein C0605_07705, partial [Hyphomicrobiales bacterium]